MINTILFLISFFCLIKDCVCEDIVNFAKASPQNQLKFPEDHNEHKKYQTEWWYYTGHIFAKDKIPFIDPSDYGFQLTFFRRALDNSDDSLKQRYLAHSAFSDFKNQKFISDSRYARGGLNLAGNKKDSYRVWNHTWFSEILYPKILLEFTVNNLDAPVELNLQLNSETREILHGLNGYSLKGDCADCASHYYSYPKLIGEGTLKILDQNIDIKSIAWFDHEYMTNALQSDQIGWDWFSIQISKNEQLMVFRVRSNTKKNYYSGTYIKDGTKTVLNEGDFYLTEKNYWKSSKTNGVYPVNWSIKVPAINFDKTFYAKINDSEVLSKEGDLAAYWEGAIATEDNTSFGFLEMTGYSDKVKF